MLFRLIAFCVPIVAVSILCIPGVSVSSDEGKDGWGGEGEAGFVAASGNTDANNINLKARLFNESKRWFHDLRLGALYADSDGVATAERYTASGKSELNIDGKDFLYARLSYEDDRFSGYDYRITETVGYGRRFFEGETLSLKAEAGPGGRHSRRKDGDKDDELVLHTAGVVRIGIGNSASLREEISVDVGESNTHTVSDTSLKSNVSDGIGLKISYEVRHDTNPPAGARSTDRVISATVVYDF